MCNHCKRKGHTADQCFKLIGYPDWYNSIKASKGYQVTGGHGCRLAAHVHSIFDKGEDSPLGDSVGEAGMVNNEMLKTICQEVMKAGNERQASTSW